MSNEAPKISWPGKSGRTYDYFIYPIGTPFIDKPGNYLYARQPSAGHWQPTYIGQTSSLRNRLADHEKESCAKRNGATHIHVHVSSDSEDARTTEEYDLIARWQPACNAIGVANG